MEQFSEMLKSDVEGFSGSHPMAVYERFANDVATVPGAVQAFLQRTPGMKPFADTLLKPSRELARNVLSQIGNSIEAVGLDYSTHPEAQRVLRVIREAEKVLR
jgi:hypothetical protein